MKKISISIIIIITIIIINCFFNITYCKSSNTNNLSTVPEYVFPLDTKKIKITKKFTGKKPYINIAAGSYDGIVYAMKEGKIVSRTINSVAIKNENKIYVYLNTVTFSKNSSSPLMSELKVGDKVAKGQPIGRVGRDGTGPYIGLGLIINSKRVNPLKYITFDENLDIDIKECNTTNNNLIIKSNKDVKFKLSTKNNYKIQISYDNTSSWKDYNNKTIKIKKGKSIFVNDSYIFTRLVDDNNNVVKMKCFRVLIDSQKPTNTKPQLISKTTSEIRIKITQSDFNLDSSKMYIAIRDASSKKNQWSKWMKCSDEKTIKNLNPNTKYEIKTKVSDYYNNTTISKKIKIRTDKK